MRPDSQGLVVGVPPPHPGMHRHDQVDCWTAAANSAARRRSASSPGWVRMRPAAIRVTRSMYSTKSALPARVQGLARKVISAACAAACCRACDRAAWWRRCTRAISPTDFQRPSASATPSRVASRTASVSVRDVALAGIASSHARALLDKLAGASRIRPCAGNRSSTPGP